MSGGCGLSAMVQLSFYIVNVDRRAMFIHHDDDDDERMNERKEINLFHSHYSKLCILYFIIIINNIIMHLTLSVFKLSFSSLFIH